MDLAIIGCMAVLGIVDVWCDRLTGKSLVERVAEWLEARRDA